MGTMETRTLIPVQRKKKQKDKILNNLDILQKSVNCINILFILYDVKICTKF